MEPLHFTEGRFKKEIMEFSIGISNAFNIKVMENFQFLPNFLLLENSFFLKLSLRRRHDVSETRPGWPWGPLDTELGRRIIQVSLISPDHHLIDDCRDTTAQ